MLIRSVINWSELSVVYFRGNERASHYPVLFTDIEINCIIQLPHPSKKPLWHGILFLFLGDETMTWVAGLLTFQSTWMSTPSRQSD